MIKKLFILFLFIFISTITYSYDNLYLNGQIIKVSDGDTYFVSLCNKMVVKVRLKDIDTFETRKIKRAYKQSNNYNIPIDEVIRKGKEAKQFVIDNYLNSNVCLKINKKKPQDIYGRIVAIVYPKTCYDLMEKSNIKSINDILIENKLANIDKK